MNTTRQKLYEIARTANDEMEKQKQFRTEQQIKDLLEVLSAAAQRGEYAIEYTKHLSIETVSALQKAPHNLTIKGDPEGYTFRISWVIDNHG